MPFTVKNALLLASTLIAALLINGCNNTTNTTTAGRPAIELPESATRSLNILVIGGTRGIGLEVVRYALQRGHIVTASARNPELMPLTDPNLEAVHGDILNPEQIAGLVTDRDAIISAIGMGPTREPVTLFSEGMGNVLHALPPSSETRVVSVTGIGAGNSIGHGGFFYDKLLQPLMLSTIYQDKDRQEQLIRESETAWTIVRPGFLNDAPITGQYRIIEDMSGITAGDISRADVAHYIISALETRSEIGKTVLLTY